MKYVWYKKGKQLSNEMSGYKPAEKEIAIWYIGQMGVYVKTRECSFMIDPVLNELCWENGKSRRNYEAPFTPEKAPAVDYILCTHNHADHLNLATINPLMERDNKVTLVIPEPELKHIMSSGSLKGSLNHNRNVIAAENNNILTLSEHLKIQPFAAAHDEYHMTPEGNSFEVGYIIYYYDKAIVHTGDTVLTDQLIAQMSAVKKIQAAFLPINGTDYERRKRGVVGNMDYHDAAYLVNKTGVDLSIPMHYDMIQGNTEDPLLFAACMQEKYPGRKYHIMQLGEKISL